MAGNVGDSQAVVTSESLLEMGLESSPCIPPGGMLSPIGAFLPSLIQPFVCIPSLACLQVAVSCLENVLGQIRAAAV